MRIDFHRVPREHRMWPYATSVFQLRGHGDYSVETLLPRGDISLLFNFGPPIQAVQDGQVRPTTWRTTIVCGLQTRPFESIPGREVHTMGVTLRPETCFAFLRTDLEDLTDTFVETSLLLPDADEVLNRVGAEKSFHARCDLLLDWLWRKASLDPTAAMVFRASRLLRRGAAAGAVARTARELDTSARQLHRVFVERVGVSPARYAKLARFVGALPLLSPDTTVTEVALKAGYFDHAHFCHDFRGFGGMTPDEYRHARSAVPGIIFKP